MKEIECKIMEKQCRKGLNMDDYDLGDERFELFIDVIIGNERWDLLRKLNMDLYRGLNVYQCALSEGNINLMENMSNIPDDLQLNLSIVSKNELPIRNYSVKTLKWLDVTKEKLLKIICMYDFNNMNDIKYHKYCVGIGIKPKLCICQIVNEYDEKGIISDNWSCICSDMDITIEHIHDFLVWLYQRDVDVKNVLMERYKYYMTEPQYIYLPEFIKYWMEVYPELGKYKSFIKIVDEDEDMMKWVNTLMDIKYIDSDSSYNSSDNSSDYSEEHSSDSGIYEDFNEMYDHNI